MNNEELRNRYRGNRRDYGLAPHHPAQPLPRRPAPAPAAPIHDTLAPAYQPRPVVVPNHLAQPARKTHRRAYKKPLAGLLVLVILASGGALGYKTLKPAAHPDPTAVLGSSTGPQIKIPVYYPLNLPAGYKFNKDFKILGTNVLYYSVTGPKGDNYYATIQPLPASFDFTTFRNKFSNPDEYTTDIGSALAGPVGATLIASVRTSTNDWIIINSPSGGSLPELETITRSLKLAKFE